MSEIKRHYEDNTSHVRTTRLPVLGELPQDDATKALKLNVFGFGSNVKPCPWTCATVLAMVAPAGSGTENLLSPAWPSNDCVWPLPVSIVTVAGAERIATAQSVSFVWSSHEAHVSGVHRGARWYRTY
jgi:hypothetical protein